MNKQLTLVCITALALTACSPSASDPCPECGDDNLGDATADLPCGGADLEKDDLNCGECGNECQVDYPGGPFEAGNCVGGQCGPRWFFKYLQDTIQGDLETPPELTCGEVCAEYSLACAEQGCSGITGYSCATLLGQGCSLTDPSEYPWGFEGACTESIPWLGIDVGMHLQVGCCCQP